MNAWADASMVPSSSSAKPRALLSACMPQWAPRCRSKNPVNRSLCFDELAASHRSCVEGMGSAESALGLSFSVAAHVWNSVSGGAGASTTAPRWRSGARTTLAEASSGGAGPNSSMSSGPWSRAK
eukprot:2358383-Pyramimonas_sp.AAC.5